MLRAFLQLVLDTISYCILESIPVHSLSSKHVVCSCAGFCEGVAAQASVLITKVNHLAMMLIVKCFQRAAGMVKLKNPSYYL